MPPPSPYSLDNLPTLPDGFFWSTDKALTYVTDRDAQGGGVEHIVSSYVIYLIDVAAAEKASDYSFVYIQYLPTKGWFQVTITASAFAGQNGAAEMAKQGSNIHDWTGFVRYTRGALDLFWKAQRNSVRYDQYGWKDGNTTFLLGAILYSANKKTTVAGSKEIETRNQWVGPGCNAKNDESVGLARWRQAAGALFAKGCEAQSICLLASFAAPLMRLLSADEGGAVVSLVTRESGTGKTLALAAASSVWGDRHGLSLTNDDNRVAKFLTLQALGNLPVVYDEIATRDPLVLREFIITFTNGRDKQRGDRSGQSVVHSGTWQTLLICASNASLVEALQHTSKTDAPAMRVLELPFEIPEGLSTVYGDKLKNDLIKNAGFAGEEYIKWIVQPEAIKWIKTALEQMQGTVQETTGLSHEYRFWIRTITAIIVAATIVHKMQLVEFDPDRICDWLLNQFAAESAFEESPVAKSSNNMLHGWQTTMLSDFIASEQINFLILPHKPEHRQTVHPQFQPKGKITGTYFNRERALYVTVNALREYAQQNEISYKTWMKLMRRYQMVEIPDRITLTAGTPMPGGQQLCVKIHMEHEAMAGSEIGVSRDDDKTNVTPLRRSTPSPRQPTVWP